MADREIVGLARSRPTREGAGVSLRRAFGFHDTHHYDPFLLLDDFRGERPEDYIAGFPWHPHRGIETITYMLEGSVEHGDSMGNAGIIGPGGVQWMTAGAGIIHQEMPKPGSEGRMGGFQLWANLPAARKMISPRYQEFPQEQIPSVDLSDGVHAVVVCGELGRVQGPVRQVEIAPGFFDVSIDAGKEAIIPTPPMHRVIAYVHGGSGIFDHSSDPRSWGIPNSGYTNITKERTLSEHHLIRFGTGNSIRVSALGTVPLQFLLIWGCPLGEPVAWGGPIVMNTREELDEAFRQLDAGTFLDQRESQDD